MDWDGESALWLQCFYGAVGGMLLRLSDIKRKQKGFFTQAIRGFFLVTLDPILVSYAGPCCKALASLAFGLKGGEVWWQFFLLKN